MNESDLKLPNLDVDMVGVCLERKLFDRLMSQADVNETATDVVEKFLKQLESKQSEEERNKRSRNVMVNLALKYNIISPVDYNKFLDGGKLELTADQIREIQLRQENDTF